jgi:hypothetical protein
MWRICIFSFCSVVKVPTWRFRAFLAMRRQPLKTTS